MVRYCEFLKTYTSAKTPRGKEKTAKTIVHEKGGGEREKNVPDVISREIGSGGRLLLLGTKDERGSKHDVSCHGGIVLNVNTIESCGYKVSVGDSGHVTKHEGRKSGSGKVK